MKRVIGLALLILLFVAVFAGLVTLMVVDGIKLKVAVFIALGSFAAVVLLHGFIILIAWLFD
jgi:hypothetical protein